MVCSQLGSYLNASIHRRYYYLRTQLMCYSEHNDVRNKELICLLPMAIDQCQHVQRTPCHSQSAYKYQEVASIVGTA